MPAYRVLVDECVDPAIINHLNGVGFDAIRVPRSGKLDSPTDAEVLAIAVDDERTVITTDISGEYQHLDQEYRDAGRPHFGIVVGHPRWGTSVLCQAFETTLRQMPEDVLHNQLHWASTVPAGP